MPIKRLMFLLFIWSACAQGQTGLDAFLRTAEEHSPQLKTFANQLSASSLQRELVRAQHERPQVSLTAGYLFAPFFNNNGHLISTAPSAEAIGYDVGITNGGLYSALINVEQPLFNGSMVDALVRQQDVQDASTQNSISLARRDLARQVTDQYLLVYQSLKVWELSKTNAENLREALTIVGRLVERGAARQADYLLLSIEADNAAIAVEDAHAQYRDHYSRLCTICGISDTTAIAIDSVALTEHAPAEHPEFIHRYEYDSLAAAVQQVQAEAKYRPQVSVFFNTGLNAVETEHIERKFGLSAGFNLSIPLYDGRQRSITRQQTELSLRSIAAERENFTVQMKNEVRSSHLKLETLRAALGHYARQRADYDRLLDLSGRDLQLGQMPVVEYLAMLRRYIDLRKSVISAETDLEREINSYNYWN